MTTRRRPARVASCCVFALSGSGALVALAGASAAVAAGPLRVEGALDLTAPVYLYADGHGRAAPGRARVELAAPAPAGGVTVTITSAPVGRLVHDSSVFIPEGQTVARFPVSATDPGRHDAALLSASALGQEVSAAVGVIPTAGNDCPPQWRQTIDYGLGGTAVYSPVTSGWEAKNPSVADFNNDGWDDIAVIDRGVGVLVFLNAGAGDGLLTVPFQIAGNYDTVQAIDVDGDNLIDLVARGGPNGGGQTVVIRNLNGASFSVIQTRSETSATTRAVYATDTIAAAPSGALPDLAIVTLTEGYSTFFSGGVRVAANQGAGTFSGNAQAFVFGNGGTSPCGPSSPFLNLLDAWPGDFNADGRLDLLIATNCTAGQLPGYRRMLTGGPTSNAGFTNAFGPAKGLLNTTLFQPLAIGDFTGDGGADVFMIELASGPVSRLALHDGGLTQIGTYGAEPIASAGALVADADANGWNDLLFTTPGFGTRILYNNGAGGLGDVFADSVPAQWGWSAHLDDDAFPDLIEITTNDQGERVLRTHLTAMGPALDINANNIPDECEPDCNGNGLPDTWEVDTGLAIDCNGNSILDTCEVVPPPVEIVFVMDTSASMIDEGQALCTEITQVIAELASQGFDVRPLLLGITEGASADFPCLEDTVAGRYGTAPAFAGGFTLGNSEDWGPATAIVAQRNDWLPRELGFPDPVRVIVPISDEGARDGEPCDDPGVDRDAVSDAIIVALANEVIASPIAGTGSNGCVVTLMQDLASGTGGSFFASTDPSADLAGAIADLVVAAAARDCNANGVPDECDIAGGFSPDTNANGVPDECEGLAPCNGELTGDGVVDGADLGLLLGAWGACPGCAADLTGDGVVDGADLGLLLGAWGGCP